jgi:hypothetical protein
LCINIRNLPRISEGDKYGILQGEINFVIL